MFLAFNYWSILRMRYYAQYLSFLASTEFQCYLCQSRLYEPRRVKRLPVEYRLCCGCKGLIEVCAINHVSYSDLCELLDHAAVIKALEDSNINNDHISKLDKNLLIFFRKISFDNVEKLKEKLRNFFLW